MNQEIQTTEISAEEKEKRRKACLFAKANVELEGFILPQSEIDKTERYINGEISFEEFMKMD